MGARKWIQFKFKKEASLFLQHPFRHLYYWINDVLVVSEGRERLGCETCFLIVRENMYWAGWRSSWGEWLFTLWDLQCMCRAISLNICFGNKRNFTFERKQLTFRIATLICATFSVLCLVCNLVTKMSFILLFRVPVLY